MMGRKQIIVDLMLGCVLLVAGCRREPVPDAGGDAIRFSFGPELTGSEAPATKFGVLKNDFNDDFDRENGEAIMVYARRNNNTSLVFFGDAVTKQGGKWTYDGIRYWSWSASGDYYDFLALYKPSSPVVFPNVSLINTSTSPLGISLAYDASKPFDLMFAGTRRNYGDNNRQGAVNLTFQRMLSAVGIKVKNISTTGTLSLKSYHFVNIISSGLASVSAESDAQDNFPVVAWSNPSRTNAEICGVTFPTAVSIPTNGTYPDPDSAFNNYDLMVPQSHEEALGTDGYPALVIEYTLGDATQTVKATVRLKDIPKAGTSTPITRWDRGVRYLYEIAIDLDGGVQVQLTIAPWDEIEAETPGLLVPPDWKTPTP